MVDGKYSLECYSRAIDGCYGAYRKREESFAHDQPAAYATNGHAANRDSIDGNVLNRHIETKLDHVSNGPMVNGQNTKSSTTELVAN